MRLRLLVLSPGRAEWNSQGCNPWLLANQKSKPWRGDRDAGVLENVAICVTPSGFRLPAETHHWGWHPRLLHATPPAFRSAPADVPFVGCVNVGHSREKYQARTVVPSALQPLQDSRCTAHGMCLLP